MKNIIYPCFKWPGTVWFYSDPHFSDEEAIRFRGNKLTDDEQIRRIHSKIGKNDTLVILGDVGNIEQVKKLRGYKVLIQGNHDVGASKYRRAVIDGIDNHLFDEVYEGCVMLNEKIILSHERVDFPYAFNIHGHEHNCRDFIDFVLKDFDSDIPSSKMANVYLETIYKYALPRMNVCAEATGYYPVCLSQILKSGVLKSIPSIHRATIDAAIERKLQNMSR